MRVSSTLLFAVIGTPLLGACASTPAWMARAEQGRQTCPPMEGYPDCVDGHHVDPVVYEPGVDRTSIQDLQARYESAIGARDPGALAALFTRDAVLEGPTGVARGRDAIRAELTQSDAASSFVRAAHVVTNAVIHIDGLKATSTASWFELDRKTPSGRPEVGSFGHYEDQFIRSGRNWLFVKRKIVMS